MKLQILNNNLLNDYRNHVSKTIQQDFDRLQDAPLSTPEFSFYTSVASVFSSKIEGENIELDSYIKHKRDGIPFQPDYTKKIDDLYGAYVYAQKNTLNETNVKEAHRILGRHIVATTWQGRYRQQNMYVATEEGRIEYVAAQPHMLTTEMERFFVDVETLSITDLTIEEVFLYAAMLHLVFVKIHPWNDGNGRTARLIEKWFLAEKLGAKAWFIQSEKMYYNYHQVYYQNLRRLGLEYEQLEFNNALPFLLMLPSSMDHK